MTYASSSLPSQHHPLNENNKLLTPNANGLTFLPRNETEGLPSKEIYPLHGKQSRSRGMREEIENQFQKKSKDNLVSLQEILMLKLLRV